MMLAKDIHYLDAHEYAFLDQAEGHIDQTEYIRVLLQADFNPQKRNLLVFINQKPIAYSYNKASELHQYFSLDDQQIWRNFLEKALHDGQEHALQIADLYITGQSVGAAYIIITERREVLQEDASIFDQKFASVANQARQYKEYCDLIADPFWVRDQRLNLIFANQAFLDLIQMTDIEMVTAQQAWFCNQRKSDMVAQLALQKNDLQSIETTYVKQGKTHHGLISEMPVIDDAGDIFLFGRLQDKTTEKSLMQRVDYLETGLREILTNISIAASIFDKNRRLRFYNKAFMDLWGFGAEYLDMAPDHNDILDKLRAQRLMPESRNFADFKDELFAPYHNIKATYEDIWHTPRHKTIKCTVSSYADGGIVCLQEDISEHIALEKSHTILSQNLRNTLDALDEGIILCDLNGKMKVINKKIIDIFQTDLELNTHLAVLYDSLDSASDLKGFIEKIYHFIQNGFPNDHHYTQECVLDDGILSASAIRLSTSDILIHIKDQTNLLNYQKMLQDKAENLEESEHIRESFFRRISHNLRDPMTSVAGFTELLETEIFGELNQKQREYVSDMRYSINDLLRITDNLADLVRLDSHSLTEFTQISLKAVMQSAIDAMQNEADSRHIKIDFSQNYANSSDDYIQGDQTLLRQSFIQILENAIMVTPRGGQIQVMLNQAQSNFNIQIIDQGSGMPQPLIDAINGQKITQIKGYGLRYILRVIGLHQGHCDVNLVTDSEQKIHGTCVQIRFALNKNI